MTAKKNKFSVRSVVSKRVKDKDTKAKPINLEALVNSGRVRMAGDELKRVADKSAGRKTK